MAPVAHQLCICLIWRWPAGDERAADVTGSVLKGRRVVLREKRWEDLDRDYKWKSDPEIARLDATLPVQLSLSQFRALYIYQPPSMEWESRTFGIDTIDGEHIGNCMYYNLDQHLHTVEIGIIIGESAYWNKGYGAEAVEILLRHIFESTRVRKIHLHTLDWNARAQKCFEKCGFRRVGLRNREGYVFLVMELERVRWEEITSSGEEGPGEQAPAVSPTAEQSK